MKGIEKNISRDFKGIANEGADKIYTEDELKGMTHDELVTYRGVIKEKLDYMRKTNPVDNSLLQEMENYHRQIEKAIENKTN